MAKTTAEKLQITPASRVFISGHAHLIEPLPEGATAAESLADATAAVLFADDEASLRALVAEHGDALNSLVVLWIAYPKGGRSDINRDTLWPILREIGLRPISQISLSDVWSALRFRRLAPGEEFDPG